LISLSGPESQQDLWLKELTNACFRPGKPCWAGSRVWTISAPWPDRESGTGEIERVADPSAGVEAQWDEAWQRNLTQAAIERVKALVDPKEFQLFDLHVLRGWPVQQVARNLRTTQARVYYAKYKVSRLVKREAKALAVRMA
jgi:hypothetical protein